MFLSRKKSFIFPLNAGSGKQIHSDAFGAQIPHALGTESSSAGQVLTFWPGSWATPFPIQHAIQLQRQVAARFH